MDFENAVRYLKSFVSYEDRPLTPEIYKGFGLERVQDFLGEYGVELGGVKFVHVAGSKGKGTVASLVTEYLSRSGRKTGLFTSPFIIDITESFWVDGEDISKEGFVELVEDLKEFIDKRGGCELTYFELLTVLVLKYFADAGVEYVVLEVGLGGRLDPTNVVTPEVSVVTYVELEHTEVLRVKKR